MSYTVEKDWTAHGFRCVAVAGSFGHRCGYVGVPAGHFLHGADFGANVPALAAAWDAAKAGPVGDRGIIPVLCNANSDEARPDCVFDVHGGLTYAGGDDYPAKSNGLWWFGFDCNHAWDAPDPDLMSESVRKTAMRFPFWPPAPDQTVRDLPYVIRQCERLAEQIAAVTPKREEES